MAHPCTIRSDVAKARLARLGKTQSSLAEELGLELRTVQRWLAGGRTTLENAERVAEALGLGTAELFEGVPSDTGSPFGFLRGLASLLGRRDSPLVQAATSVLENFEFLDHYVTFEAHPRHGFVRRIRLGHEHARGFARFRIEPSGAARIAFGAKIARSLGYEFGEVVRDGLTLSLVEHFHTRSMRARARPDGSFDIDVWIPREMRELVVVADADVEVGLRAPTMRSVFDLGHPSNAHALCFRPSTSHLREMGLPTWDDRIRGDRAGRVDDVPTSS